MKRRILAAMFGCFIGVLPVVAIKAPDSPLTDVVGYISMILALPGVWVAIMATRRVDANFWIMVPVNAAVYGLVAYLLLSARAKRKAAIGKQSVPQGTARK